MQLKMLYSFRCIKRETEVPNSLVQNQNHHPITSSSDPVWLDMQDGHTHANPQMNISPEFYKVMFHLCKPILTYL